MLTRFTRIQLAVFTLLTVIALGTLAFYYLRLPTLAGVGHYTLTADLPVAGGLYETANVTYRGITIGKVVDVQPTATGAQAVLRIDDAYKVPADASANVHSVSAAGEQYLDLASPHDSGPYLQSGQTITKSTVPSHIGKVLDAANHALAVLPEDKIPVLLDETSRAVGGLGPVLQRLVDSSALVASDFEANLGDVRDIITNSAPIIDSQVVSGDEIAGWTDNVDALTTQAADNDPALRSVLTQAAPATEEATVVLSGVRDALPQVLANTEIVLDMLKRYHAGLEMYFVVLPQGASILQTATSTYPGSSALDFSLALNQPPPCLTGFLPATQWRSPADTSRAALPNDVMYCKVPKEAQMAVRGARNFPCVDVPGKRAATPQECRSSEPYKPAGTNPWYGDPNQILSCPAAAARCDQAVEPGKVIPAPSINNGLNPLPANQLPAPSPPASDPFTPPRQGTVQCSGQQPNPCVYTPSLNPFAQYNLDAGEVEGPDGVRYTVGTSEAVGDNGWKHMLAPAHPVP
jgi:phospholipid/cholesterol/gamma-HCH transport system substrate-binding protein